MLANIKSAASWGIEAVPVEIEVDVAQGLPQLIVVGLPDTSVKEARERVRSAIRNSGYRFPPEKITINLAPADLKKEGSAYDLPIALGILAATDVLSADALNNFIFLGELALDGSLRPFKGAIAITESLKAAGRKFIFPYENASEAAFSLQAEVYGVRSLQEAVAFLRREKELKPVRAGCWETALEQNQTRENRLDFHDIKGQYQARRAAEIAAAGGHNLLLIGSPGSGKTMLAQRLPGILPPLTYQEALEITRIHSLAGALPHAGSVILKRPFRSPHHTISAVAMSGGGSWPKPGEVSLAHHGVLFLDEFPEFKREVIETLRAPLEDGQITISRTKTQMNYPCRFMLIAAMNPCPCGYLMDTRRPCRCSLTQIQKYQGRISGPLLDRMDLHVEVPSVEYKNLTSGETAESSEEIRRRVLAARQIQKSRKLKHQPGMNARMTPGEIKKHCTPDEEGRQLLEKAMKEIHLSARAYFKILKIARTIADLGAERQIQAVHIAEAVQYRYLDRQWS